MLNHIKPEQPPPLSHLWNVWFVRYKNIFNRGQNLTCVTNTVLGKKKSPNFSFVWIKLGISAKGDCRVEGDILELRRVGPLAIGAD